MRCLHQFPWCCLHSWWASIHCGTMCVGALHIIVVGGVVCGTGSSRPPVWAVIVSDEGFSGTEWAWRGIRGALTLTLPLLAECQPLLHFTRGAGGDGRGGWRLSPAALTSLRATGRMCRGLVRRYRWLLSNINHPFTELSLHWPVTQLGESCRTELWHSGLSLQSKHSNVYRYLGYLNTNLKLT